MTASDEVVFLFDCDNTLLDNDAVQDDLRSHLEREFGPDESARYWSIYEALRTEVGYADYLGAMQRFRLVRQSDPRVLQLAYFLLEYPFASRLYPHALEAVAYCRRRGPTVMMSDGDAVLQPRKLRRSGLWDAVEGRVLIYIHKETMLDEMAQLFPARHYVMVDDKLRVLAAMKKILGIALTTVFPRQGHYALDAAAIADYPAADVTIECIGDLLQRGIHMKATQQLHDLGQSLWLDNITRGLLTSGTLAGYIRDSVGDRPHLQSHDLRKGDRRLPTSTMRPSATRRRAGNVGEALFFELALEDLTQAADLFRAGLRRHRRHRRLGFAGSVAAAGRRHRRHASRRRRNCTRARSAPTSSSRSPARPRASRPSRNRSSRAFRST